LPTAYFAEIQRRIRPDYDAVGVVNSCRLRKIANGTLRLETCNTGTGNGSHATLQGIAELMRAKRAEARETELE